MKLTSIVLLLFYVYISVQAETNNTSIIINYKTTGIKSEIKSAVVVPSATPSLFLLRLLRQYLRWFKNQREIPVFCAFAYVAEQCSTTKPPKPTPRRWSGGPPPAACAFAYIEKLCPPRSWVYGGQPLLRQHCKCNGKICQCPKNRNEGY